MSFMTDQVLRDVRRVIETRVARMNVKAMLDIGCWDGEATRRYASLCNADEVHGVEIFEGPAASARSKGINVQLLDLENGVLPYEGSYFDLVIANQVFEHLKNIFTLLSDIHRILKVGGTFIFSVPNLASLHNRLLLLLGAQPTSIRIVGPHVRGFCYHHTKRFLLHGGLFSLSWSAGCGLYPLPAFLAKPVVRKLPGISHTFVIGLQKTSSDGPTWDKVVKELGFQTNYIPNGDV